MDSITIVGMGTSDERQLTLEAADALLHAPRLVLRTARHGVAAYLTAQGASFESLDALYERADDFETLAEEAADYLEGMLAQGPITYGVPGQGLMEDDTVGCLVRRGLVARIPVSYTHLVGVGVPASYPRRPPAPCGYPLPSDPEASGMRRPL